MSTDRTKVSPPSSKSEYATCGYSPASYEDTPSRESLSPMVSDMYVSIGYPRVTLSP